MCGCGSRIRKEYRRRDGKNRHHPRRKFKPLPMWFALSLGSVLLTIIYLALR